MSYRDTILAYADRQYPLYRRIALDIHANPETSNHEFYACGLLSEQLRKEGFDVTVDVAGHPTGFSAVYRAEDSGDPADDRDQRRTGRGALLAHIKRDHAAALAAQDQA